MKRIEIIMIYKFYSLSNMSQVNLQVLSLIFSPDFKPVKLYDNVLESKKRYNKRI